MTQGIPLSQLALAHSLKCCLHSWGIPFVTIHANSSECRCGLQDCFNQLSKNLTDLACTVDMEKTIFQ